MKRVLVLCTGNSCRSQMVEGYLRRMLPEGWEVRSAGVERHGLNPYMVRVMEEDGVDVRDHTSNLVEEYRDLTFHLVLTVCDHARETCPWYPDEAVRVHQSFADPAAATGSEDEKLAVYRATRDAIKAWLPGFVKDYATP